MKYRVFIDDNFHYMDESERYEAGTFETCSEAVEFCKKVVDDCLEGLLPGHREQNPPLDSTALLTYYTSFGDDPFIISDDEICRFSAWDYAKIRCRELVN